MKLIIEPSASLLLAKISNLLIEQGIKSYLVGGFVRDGLLGRNTADIDIVVAGDALEIAPEVAAAVDGKYVLLDKINRIGRVVLVNEGTALGRSRWNIDFSTLRGSIEQDLAQRDFTVDAMAIDLGQIIYQPRSPFESGKEQIGVQLIDYFGGQEDLHRGVIRVVSETAFASDAVRLLRAVRLAAELDFSIDKQTEALIQRHGHLLGSVAGERVREELLRLVATSRAGQLWQYLDELGLGTVIIPELGQLKGVQQPKEHFWDVFNHSLQTVVAVDFLLRRGDWEYAHKEVLAAVPWSMVLAQHFGVEVSYGSTRGSLLKLAALLHDIAKPQTKTIDESGRVRFLGHADEGAAIVVNIMERLRFSAKEIKLVEIMVRHHLRPGQMSNTGFPSRRAIYRYFRDSGEVGIDILFLSLADHLAARGPSLNPEAWREHTQVVEYVLAQRFQEETLINFPKLIDGQDLINDLGMSPGPQIGEFLELVREAQAIGELTTKSEALAYIRTRVVTEVT